MRRYLLAGAVLASSGLAWSDPGGGHEGNVGRGRCTISAIEADIKASGSQPARQEKPDAFGARYYCDRDVVEFIMKSPKLMERYVAPKNTVKDQAQIFLEVTAQFQEIDVIAEKILSAAKPIYDQAEKLGFAAKKGDAYEVKPWDQITLTADKVDGASKIVSEGERSNYVTGNSPPKLGELAGPFYRALYDELGGKLTEFQAKGPAAADMKDKYECAEHLAGTGNDQQWYKTIVGAKTDVGIHKKAPALSFYDESLSIRLAAQAEQVRSIISAINTRLSMDPEIKAKFAEKEAARQAQAVKAAGAVKGAAPAEVAADQYFDSAAAERGVAVNGTGGAVQNPAGGNLHPPAEDKEDVVNAEAAPAANPDNGVVPPLTGPTANEPGAAAEGSGGAAADKKPSLWDKAKSVGGKVLDPFGVFSPKNAVIGKGCKRPDTLGELNEKEKEDAFAAAADTAEARAAVEKKRADALASVEKQRQAALKTLAPEEDAAEVDAKYKALADSTAGKYDAEIAQRGLSQEAQAAKLAASKAEADKRFQAQADKYVTDSVKSLKEKYTRRNGTLLNQWRNKLKKDMGYTDANEAKFDQFEGKRIEAYFAAWTPEKTAKCRASLVGGKYVTPTPDNVAAKCVHADLVEYLKAERAKALAARSGQAGGKDKKPIPKAEDEDRQGRSDP